MSFFASGRLYVCISVWAFIYSLSIPAYAIQGDLNGDNSVNHIDLYEFVLQWLGDAGGNANLDGDGDVDFADFALLATNWLEDTESVIINEFMAINDDTLLDGNGESSDWIELYNTGMQDINLSGWRLTDDADDLTKWMFPAIEFSESDVSSYVTLLQAGDNVLAFHGLNRSTTSSDFLISAEVTARKVVESTASTPMYFETPTPGTANADAFVEYVDAPTISQDHGFYSGSFDVGISCDDEDAIIRYTTDGSDPSMTNGEIYTGWITIDHTTCLRAIAYKAEPGWLPSNIKTVTYLFIDDVIAQGATPPAGWPTSSINGQVFDYGMDSKVLTDSRYADLIDDALLDIPSLSLVTDFANLFDSSSGIYVNAMQDGSLWERPVSVELLNPDGTEGFQIDGGIRIRGGMSRQSSNLKHSFRLYFRSEYGESKLNYPLFGDEGVDQFDKIDLRTGQNFSWHLGHSSSLGNSTWLYDVFSRDAAGQMEQPYTRSRYYHLYINGLYWGLYQSEERPEARYAASYYGGDKEDYDAIKSGDDQGVSQ